MPGSSACGTTSITSILQWWSVCAGSGPVCPSSSAGLQHGSLPAQQRSQRLLSCDTAGFWLAPSCVAVRNGHSHPPLVAMQQQLRPKLVSARLEAHGTLDPGGRWAGRAGVLLLDQFPLPFQMLCHQLVEEQFATMRGMGQAMLRGLCLPGLCLVHSCPTVVIFTLLIPMIFVLPGTCFSFLPVISW